MIVLIILFCSPSNAQTFGLKGGLSLANMLTKDDDGTYSNDYKMNPGFHIGATLGLPFTHFLSLESGLLLTTKGAKYEDEVMGVDVSAKTDLYYLDIPVTLKAAHELSRGIKIIGAVGPYVGVGISGKAKATAKYQGTEVSASEDISWGNDEDEDDLKRLDLGLTVGGGVEINAIQIGISYDMGLSNISAYQEYGTINKNRLFKFSVGYRFGN